ncbi:MAG TPA: HDOD domain-containing protein, partial [Methylococcaceae bacterium]|nr:HDOD domain-containing protein [Methylococcaceae bacterium]
METEFNFHELKTSDRLPSPSGTALAIMRLAQREEATVQELAHLVQSDPALTGRILRLANSPAIGVRRPIASVVEGVSLLGMKAVRQFALSLSLVGKHQQGHCEAFDYPAYWSSSLANAVAIQSVTARERTVAPEEAFTLGLLAEIGSLALATAWPEEYGEVLRQAKGEAPFALERERFAIDRNALSVMLLADWGFPTVFLDALKQSLETDSQEESRAARFGRQLVFARNIARYCLADTAYRSSLLPDLQTQAARHVLDESALNGLLEHVEDQWREWGKLIRVGTDLRQSQPEALPVEEPAAGGLAVLLVDDDPIMLARLSKQLAAAGHRVATCRDGESALAHVLEHGPQLVITDWHMRPTDGLRLCRTLRASVYGKSLYLIMLTATEDEDALVEAFDAGIDDYIIKPPNLKVLNARIRGGQRIINLQQDLIRERKEIERYSAELALANRRLELMANTDLLTGLPNRRYALSRLEQEWAAALRHRRPLSVMILDLDHFKTVNDTLGHEAGDRVLAHAAKVMREAVRASDIVCRLGGEEFLVIAVNTDGAAAVSLGERVRSAIEQHQPEGLTLARPVTVS